MIRVGDLANILGSPVGATHKIDQIIVWDIRGSISTVYIWANQLPLQIAVQHDIPLIMYGENGEVEWWRYEKRIRLEIKEIKTTFFSVWDQKI
jgi:hypothetical protein